VSLPPGIAISFVLLDAATIAFTPNSLQRPGNGRCIKLKLIATIFGYIAASMLTMCNELVAGFLNAT